MSSGRPRLLLIDNYDSFTYNLVQAFLVLGAEVLVYRNDAISPSEADALARRQHGEAEQDRQHEDRPGAEDRLDAGQREHELGPEVGVQPLLDRRDVEDAAQVELVREVAVA